MRVGITGGKGGTGKSTISVNLAHELSKNKKVVLLDMDSECPNDHILLNASLENKKEVEIFVPQFNERCDLCGKCVEKCPEHAIVMFNNKIKVITELCSGCKICKLVCPKNGINDWKKIVGYTYMTKINENFLLGTSELLEGERESVHPVNSIKKRIPDGYDFYIYDTPAGTHSNVVSALKDTDVIIAVTEPTPFGLHDLKLIVELGKKINKNIYVVINRYDIGDNSKIEKLCKDNKIDIISRIKFSKKIMEFYVNKSVWNDNIEEYKEIKKIANFLVGLK